MSGISPEELIGLLRDETYTDWKLEADAADLIEQQADLIEANGKRLALAEKTIADAATALDVRGIPFGADMLAVWDRHIAEAKAALRDYDAVKKAGL